MRLCSAPYGVPAGILRLGNVYGPGQPGDRNQGSVAALLVAALLAAACAGTTVPLYGDGEVARDFVHVDDVTDAVLRLPPPDDGVGICNVGTGVDRTLNEVIDIIIDVTGVTVHLHRKPERPYDVRRICLSIDKLTALIPYAPVGLEVGIARTWHSLKSGAASAATSTA